MKRFLALIILSMFFIAGFTQNVRMGLTASPLVSWLDSDAGSIQNDGAQIGFKFGLVTDLFFAERYSFSTGIIINNIGGSLSYGDSLNFKASDQVYNLAPDAVIKYKLQYVDIPMTFKMESNKIGYFKYYAQFGVINQIRVSASADITATENYSGVGCKDEVNLFNMNYTIGAGALYYFSKNTAVSLGVSYVNGFLDISNNDDKVIGDKATLRHVSVNVGLLF